MTAKDPSLKPRSNQENIAEKTRRKRCINNTFAESSKTIKVPTSKANKTCFLREKTTNTLPDTLDSLHTCFANRAGNGDNHVRK